MEMNIEHVMSAQSQDKERYCRQDIGVNGVKTVQLSDRSYDDRTNRRKVSSKKTFDVSKLLDKMSFRLRRCKVVYIGPAFEGYDFEEEGDDEVFGAESETPPPAIPREYTSGCCLQNLQIFTKAFTIESNEPSCQINKVFSGSFSSNVVSAQCISMINCFSNHTRRLAARSGKLSFL
jgi:hypothetical protein